MSPLNFSGNGHFNEPHTMYNITKMNNYQVKLVVTTIHLSRRPSWNMAVHPSGTDPPHSWILDFKNA
jgi:hypothetical protein